MRHIFASRVTFTHLIRASATTLVVVERDASQHERHEEDDVRREDVDVPERQPPLEDPLTT